VLIIENYFNDEGYRQYMAERGYALWRAIEPNDVYVRVNPLSTVAEWLLRRVLRLGVRRPGRVAP
jgi:hypothetical protein